MAQSQTGKLFSTVLKALVKFASGLNAVATIWTFMLVFFVTADVVGRFVFNHPITGTPEIVQGSLVGLAFLYLPHTTWTGRQIKSDLLQSLLGLKFKRIMKFFSPLFGMAVFLLIAYTNWYDMMEAWRIGEWEGEGTMRVPVAPFRTILVAGSVLTAVFYAVRCYEGALELVARREKED
ncbi:TRAP transporter small permease [bacterium]|nr:TRAP transporter small permease [bacterium]